MTEPSTTYRRPLPLIAVVGPILAVMAGLALLLAGPGSRWDLWHYRTGFSIMRWAAYLGMFAALLSILGAVATRPGSGRRGFGIALLGLIIGLATFVIPWTIRNAARGAPPIHDISTDTESPPAFVAIAPLRADAPNPLDYEGDSVARLQRSAYPEIVPLDVPTPPARTFRTAVDVVSELGWELVAADSSAMRIEASDRTFWFGFVDDVVIRVTPRDGGSRVDARSVSRVGRGDAGANARRLVRLLGELRLRLTGD